MIWDNYGYCKELFWLTPNILVFLDTMTDYIWIYNVVEHNPIYIFTGYSKFKKFFQN